MTDTNQLEYAAAMRRAVNRQVKTGFTLAAAKSIVAYEILTKLEHAIAHVSTGIPMADADREHTLAVLNNSFEEAAR